MLYDYFRFRAAKERLLSNPSLNNDQKKEVRNQLLGYRSNFLKEYPNHPMSVVFKIQENVRVPDSWSTISEPEVKQVIYDYQLTHYWDKVDF